MEMQRIGLLAGAGHLPIAFARRAKMAGLEVVAVSVMPGVKKGLAPEVAQCNAIPVTQWELVVKTFKSAGVKQIFLLGKVSKAAFFSGTAMDERFLSVVEQAKDGRDDHLFQAFAADLARDGIAIGRQDELLPDLFPGPKLLTQRAPTAEEAADVEFGLDLAKKVAGLDIGQTVVVKRQAVLAVEAVDGTNATLRRGGPLGGGDVVAVKVTKPLQDMRFDVPTVGPETVEAMVDGGVRVLAFEAHRTFVVNEEELVRQADEAELTILAVPAEAEGGTDSCASS